MAESHVQRVYQPYSTSQYDEDFSIIVNLRSFGQIQIDLSILLQLERLEDVYPWAVKLEDLEVFLLTMKARGKGPWDIIDFLLLREDLHGKLISSDECQICGAYITGWLNEMRVEKEKLIVGHPDMANVFDEQYQKGMGFRNEKMLKEKTSGRYIFW